MLFKNHKDELRSTFIIKMVKIFVAQL